MKRKVRVYKPMAQQGMQQQQQAPDPQLVIGSVVNSLSSTMDNKGNIDYTTLDQIQIELEKLYGTEGANQILQQALDQIKVGQTQQAPTQQAAPQAMIDPNYNPFAEEEAMNQQIMDEALTETPVDLVARRGLQTYQGNQDSEVYEDAEAMGDFYGEYRPSLFETTYPKSSTAVEPVITYDPLLDNPAFSSQTTSINPYTLSPQTDPFFSDAENKLHMARGMFPANLTEYIQPTPTFTPEEAARIAEEVKNINDPFNDQWSQTNKKVRGGMTKKKYAKNVMNYVKQAGGMQEAEMVDNTDDMMNTRQNTLANFFNTLANQSQAGVVNEFAEGTYDQFNDYMQRGGQRRAMRQANRAMRRAGRAMRGMPMMPGFMPMASTQFGPANPFVSQFFPVNATASTNINPYGIESIESYGRGLFRRPKTTINFFNPYDHMDRTAVDAETVDAVTETPVDGNNQSMDGKVQSQAKTNTEVEQVEAHSQKKDNSKSGKKEAAKAETKAEELDQSNTATNKDPRLAAMQEWKDIQAQRYSEGRDMSSGESIYFQDLPLGLDQDRSNPYAAAMGDLQLKDLIGKGETAWNNLSDRERQALIDQGYNFNPQVGIIRVDDMGATHTMTPEEEAAMHYNLFNTPQGAGNADWFWQDYFVPGLGLGRNLLKNAGTAALEQFTLRAAPKGFLPGARMLPGARSLGPGRSMLNPGQAMLNRGQAMLNTGQKLLPAGPMQFGGFVNPDLYKYVYGAQKKKAKRL
jgi:hypothetical protein